MLFQSSEICDERVHGGLPNYCCLRSRGLVAGDLLNVRTSNPPNEAYASQRQEYAMLHHPDCCTKGRAGECLELCSHLAPRSIQGTRGCSALHFVSLRSAATDQVVREPLWRSLERNLHASIYGQILGRGTAWSVVMDGKHLRYRVTASHRIRGDTHSTKDAHRQACMRYWPCSGFHVLTDCGIVGAQVCYSRMVPFCAGDDVNFRDQAPNKLNFASHTMLLIDASANSNGAFGAVGAGTRVQLDNACLDADEINCEHSILHRCVPKHVCCDVEDRSVLIIDYRAMSASTSLNAAGTSAMIGCLMGSTPQSPRLFVIGRRRMFKSASLLSSLDRYCEVLASSWGLLGTVDCVSMLASRKNNADFVYLIPDFMRVSRVLSTEQVGKALASASSIGMLDCQIGNSCVVHLSAPIKVVTETKNQLLHATQRVKLCLGCSAHIQFSVPDCRLMLRRSGQGVRFASVQFEFMRTVRCALQYQDSPRPWHGVAGLGGLKALLRLVINSRIGDLGTLKQQSVLLYGPPGCSKTILARAIAHEARRCFVAVHGGDLLTRWLGESERAIRVLFEHARAASPSVLFFDEIDAIATMRSLAARESSTVDRVLTQLMIELDDCNGRIELALVAATNRPDLLEPALLRPGRMDRLIFCPPPSVASAKEIIKYAFENTPLDSTLSANTISNLANTLSSCFVSGAQLIALARHAALLAIQANCIAIQLNHVLEAANELTNSSSLCALPNYQAWRQIAQNVVHNAHTEVHFAMPRS